MRVAPIAPARATQHGAYGYQRARRRHAGIDIGAKVGARVVAPERMTVIAVAFNNTTKPLSGYGPAAVMARGDSGVVHVLGHMGNTWPNARPEIGQTYEAGELVGFVGPLKSGPHCHWEVRRGDRAPWPVATRMADTIDPIEWLSENRTDDDSSTVTVLDQAAQMARALKAAVVDKAVDGALSWGVGILLLYVATKRRR